MKISEIYRKYRIPPQLQLHQLRVASIAKYICDNLKVPVDIEEVVSADLLHDMGNIIKFDLSLFPEYLEPEGLEYWQGVKNDFHDLFVPFSAQDLRELPNTRIRVKFRIFEV